MQHVIEVNASSTRQHQPANSTRLAENNFDIARLCLASFVFLGHYSWIFPDGPLPSGLIRFLIGDDSNRCVEAFFVISGFLMFQSFDRSDNVMSYSEKRIRRIVPAYVTVILLSALFGFWLSNLDLRQYLSLDLAKYVFWNLLFLNFMHPTLPGVFDNLPIHQVNGPLWTLKIEVTFYILLPFLVRFGRRIGFIRLFFGLYVLSILYHSYFIALENRTGSHMYGVLASQLPGQLCYFVSGALIAAWWRGRIGLGDVKGSLWMVLGGAVLVSLGLFYSGVSFIYPAFLAALVLSFCLVGPKLGRWMVFGDWSYGVYVIHFPVLQALRSLGTLESHPVLLFLLASAIIFGLSALMWNFVESPALKGRWVKERAVPTIPQAATVDL